MEMLSQKSPATLLTVPWRGGISVLRSAGAKMIVVTVSFILKSAHFISMLRQDKLN